MSTYTIRPLSNDTIRHPFVIGYWFRPVVEFLALRLLSGGAAAVMVYAGYVMFQH